MIVNRDWQLFVDGELKVQFGNDNFEFTVAWNKLIFSWWGEEVSNSWRLVAYKIAETELQFQAVRGIGGEKFSFTLRDADRWSQPSPQEFSLNESRARFSETLSQILREKFSDLKIQRIGLRHKFSHGNPGQYVRFLLRIKNENVLLLAINKNESPANIDGLLHTGLQWHLENKIPITKLWLGLPPNRSQTTLERLTLLVLPSLRIECFEIDEKEKTMTALRPFSQAELINLHPRSLIWPEPENGSRSNWRERITALAPDAIEIREDKKGERFSLNGLEFARGKGPSDLLFGIANYPDEIAERFGRKNDSVRIRLTERNFSQLENLVRELLTYRCADSPDLRHSFYRLRSEAWLESLLRRDIRALDPTFDQRFVYSQIPAWLGEDRSVLDLLTVNREGRLVIVEIKTAEDSQLPLQGLDYWLRVEQARLRREFERRGLFPGIKIADRSPLLYLVAPRLRFHRSFDSIAGYFAPEIEAYRIGLNSNWRSGVKARVFERIGRGKERVKEEEKEGRRE